MSTRDVGGRQRIGGGSAGGLSGRLVRRDVRSTETKNFSKTSEFFVWLDTVIAVLAAVLLVEEFGPDRGWTLVTILSSAYMISRGLAKSGSREPYYGDDGSDSNEGERA